MNINALVRGVWQVIGQVEVELLRKYLPFEVCHCKGLAIYFS